MIRGRPFRRSFEGLRTALSASTSFVLTPYQREFTRLQKCLLALGLSGLALIFLIGGYFYALTTPFMLTQFLIPLLPLASVAIWALPDGRAAPATTIHNLFFAFLISVLVWPEYLAINFPGLPWITSVRLVGFPLCYFLLMGLSTSPEFRSEIAQTARAVPYLLITVTTFVALQVASIFYSGHPQIALNNVIADQISSTVIFFTACFVFRKPGTIELWAKIMWVSAIVVCGLGLWEWKLGVVPWADHLPSFFATDDEYVQRVLHGARRLGIGEYRVQSVHSTSLGLAEYLALTTPFLIHYVMGPFRAWTRIAAAATIPLVFVVILFSGARLGMVGFFFAGMLYLLGWGVIRWRTQRLNLLGAAVVYGYPAIFVAFMTATFTIGRLKRMIWGGGETEASNQGRLDQLADGIPLIIKQPWGYGYKVGASVLDYRNGNDILTIDNYFLMVALDMGIVGLLVYIGMLLVSIWYAGKYAFFDKARDREQTFLIPLSVALTVFFIIKSIFSQTHNHTLQFMMSAMVAVLVLRIKLQNSAVPTPKNVDRGR